MSGANLTGANVFEINIKLYGSAREKLKKTLIVLTTTLTILTIDEILALINETYPELTQSYLNSCRLSVNLKIMKKSDCIGSSLYQHIHLLPPISGG